MDVAVEQLEALKAFLAPAEREAPAAAVTDPAPDAERPRLQRRKPAETTPTEG